MSSSPLINPLAQSLFVSRHWCSSSSFNNFFSRPTIRPISPGYRFWCAFFFFKPTCVIQWVYHSRLPFRHRPRPSQPSPIPTYVLLGSHIHRQCRLGKRRALQLPWASFRRGLFFFNSEGLRSFFIVFPQPSVPPA